MFQHSYKLRGGFCFFLPCWISWTPDLNPLDYGIRSILESKVCAQQYASVDSLKASLEKEWNSLPQEVIRKTCDAFFSRLQSVIKSKGDHIEM